MEEDQLGSTDDNLEKYDKLLKSFSVLLEEYNEKNNGKVLCKTKTSQ